VHACDADRRGYRSRARRWDHPCDLKPANIKIRGDGSVKVLDFGLGKSVAPTNGHVVAGETATDSYDGLAQNPTAPGLVLGTPAYMAPEQARGKPVDKRADIWAFGCVFYEVLTGRRLFEGATASDTLAAVLTGDIDLDRVPARLPPRVRRLLARCLDRDPRTRLRDIGEARVALQRWDEPVDERAPRLGDRAGRILVWALTAGLVIACLIIAVLWQRGTPGCRPSSLNAVPRQDLAGDSASLPRVNGPVESALLLKRTEVENQKL
jgi:eukaryotic-like serine/threonine-protein kinase